MERRDRPNIDTVREVLREEEEATRPEPSRPQEDEPSDQEAEEQNEA